MRKAFSIIEPIMVVAVICIVAALILPFFTEKPAPIFTEKQEEAIKVVSNITYVKDPSTDLVFAIYRDSGMYREGFGYMAIVPPEYVSRIKNIIEIEIEEVIKKSNEQF